MTSYQTVHCACTVPHISTTAHINSACAALLGRISADESRYHEEALGPLGESAGDHPALGRRHGVPGSPPPPAVGNVLEWSSRLRAGSGTGGARCGAGSRGLRLLAPGAGAAQRHASK